jgi:hypothetical protein
MLTGVQTVDQFGLSSLLDFTVKHGGNLMIFGDSGTGKTEMSFQATDRASLKHVYLNLSVLEAPDLVGLPMIDEKTGKAKYALPEAFPLYNADSDGMVLIVDEIDKAKPELQNPCLELFQFRSINGVKLNFKAVIATGNLPDEYAHSQMVSHALTNRCGVYRTSVSFDAWRYWALRARVNPLVVGFLSQNPSFLLQKPPAGEETAYCHPSPRAWTLAARDLDFTDESTSVDFQDLLVAGRVGNGAAIKFKVWLEHYRYIAPRIRGLVDKGQHPFLDIEKPSIDRVFVCAIAGVDEVMKCATSRFKEEDKHNHMKRVHGVLSNVCDWLDRIPPEICIGAFKSALTYDISKEFSFVENREFVRVYQKVQKSLDGEFQQ